MRVLRWGLLIALLAGSSCGGGTGDGASTADDHARAACAARAKVVEGASKVLAGGSERLAAELEQAQVESLREARAAAAADDQYDAFAKGIEAEQASLDPDSTRQLEANTARREVIDPTCGRLRE